MKVGDLAIIIQPSFDFGDSQLIIDAWTYEKPVLILKESHIKYPDGKRKATVLIKLGKKSTWILKDDLEPIDEEKNTR